MADLTLTWHLAGIAGAGSDKGPAYRLGKNYGLVRVWARSAVTKDGNLTYDINADGSSILSGPAMLPDKVDEVEGNVTASAVTLDEGKVITLDIDSVSGSRADVTIQLDLEEN